jgi:predicted metal-dependent HD superfamily phosphohydrolase
LRRKLPKHCYYHGVHHTLAVERAVTRLAAAEGVTGTDLVLLKTAALYHDSGFMVKYRDNEAAGCALARTTLPAYGYANEDIETICGMIMATRLPQCPRTRLEEILCDADLGHLGTAAAAAVSDTLRQELEVRGVSFTDQEWLEFQVDFLVKHRYFTAAARARCEIRKNKYLQTLKRRLATIKKGV